jgi:hypothetical protein
MIWEGARSAVILYGDTTLNIMALNIMGFISTLSMNDKYHNDFQHNVILSIFPLLC